MTEALIPSSASEIRLPEEQLRDEARRLYVDFLKTLLSIPEFRELFVAQYKSGVKANKPINFELNGKSYRVEVRCKDYPYDVLKIGEYEIDVPFPNKRLQIQIPIQGYPERSTIVLFQLDVHSEAVGSFPMLRDNQATIQSAREFLVSLNS